MKKMLAIICKSTVAVSHFGTVRCRIHFWLMWLKN